MIERLVQSDARGAADTFNDFDLARNARRASASSRRTSMHDVMLREDVRGMFTKAESPLSSLFDSEMVRVDFWLIVFQLR